jgi:predicted PurR-regulated permease PerM
MLGFTHKKSDTSEVWVNISNQTIIRVLIMVIVSLLGLLAIRKAAHALELILIAFFLALALNTPVHWLAVNLPGKLRGSRVMATGISFLVVIVVLGAFLASIIPPLVRQTDNFIKQAPQLVQDVRNQNSGIGKIVRKYHLQSQVNAFAQQLSVRLQHATGSAVSDLGNLAKSLFSVLAILALTFMMVIEGPTRLKQIRTLTPREHLDHIDKLSKDMYAVIRGYVNGQVLLAILAAALITPMLFILHISYPLALLVVIFICGLIPLVGHSIGAVIVTIVALFHSPISALIILIYYILYQQIETYVISPRIQSDTTNLSPLLVFTAVVVGVNFGGLIGGLFAIPVAGCLRVLFVDYWHSRGKILSESATTQPPPPIDDTK